VSTLFDEFKQRIQNKLLDLATGGAAGDAFVDFHNQMHDMKAMMPPSLLAWVKGATGRFAEMHDVTDPMQLTEAYEMFWFGWWARGQFDQGNLTIPVHMDD
jgi:hypothetical protein